ncbi:hypothetical protein VN97_g11957 [Penicillium thymicola]|uniref:RNase H type-1 domain-containing protein n=1 Tax=Penicillium thymicola TaxID=293382 RepID=A0AAI9T672_PENTH|nr:hypothetical protein VN97_g11957 [Penicillium thymicola]
MISCHSDPIHKDWDLLQSHSPPTTLPPPPGTKEGTTTEIKDVEAPLTPPPAQYTPVTTTELQDGELEEGETAESPPPPETKEGTPSELKGGEAPLTPPPAQYTPVTTTELQDGELEEGEITESSPPRHYPQVPSHATTKVEPGEPKQEYMQPTPPNPPYSIVPSIEIDDEDIFILPTILTSQHREFHPDGSRRAPWGDPDRYVRSANPSPESTQEERLQVDVRVNVANGKRKRTPSQSIGGLRPPKKEKASTEQNEPKMFCWELGQEFTGFVSLINGPKAREIAINILRLPIPNNVNKRLVYFCDASIHSLCGAVGVVWPKDFTFTKWEGKGFPYPVDIDNTAILELFGISRTLEMAIRDMEEPRADVDRNQPQDKLLFQSHLDQTRSHLHGMSKEVFIFTDDIFALKRIDGSVSYTPNGGIASQLAAISRHSKTLGELGVHVELHLSPGHTAIPGNVAADEVAKRAQSWVRHQRMADH